jgi:hypothetical protein
VLQKMPGADMGELIHKRISPLRRQGPQKGTRISKPQRAEAEEDGRASKKSDQLGLPIAAGFGSVALFPAALPAPK